MASGATEGLLIQGSSNEKPLFMDVNADEEAETTEIESLCMQCGENVRQLCCGKCYSDMCIGYYEADVNKDPDVS